MKLKTYLLGTFLIILSTLNCIGCEKEEKITLNSPSTTPSQVTKEATPKQIDLFDSQFFRCDFDYPSPNIRAVITNHALKMEAPFNTIRYSINKHRGLKKGEKVIITATYDKEAMKKHGYTIISDTKKVPATCEEEYVTSITQINEKCQNRLIKYSAKRINSSIRCDYSLDVAPTKWEFLGNYVLSTKADGYHYAGTIYYIFKGKLTLYGKPNITKTVYVACDAAESPTVDEIGNLTWKYTYFLYRFDYPDDSFGSQSWNKCLFPCFETEKQIFKALVTSQTDYDHYEVSGSLTDFSALDQ